MVFNAHLNLILKSLPFLLKGMVVTLELTFAFLSIGLVVGMFLALGQVYGRRSISLLISAFERIFRAIPALVLLFLFYFGAAQFGFNLSAFAASCLALGLRSAAYQSQIFRGAIQSIDIGQIMAARAIGMTQFKAAIYIVLPQALRLSIAPWSNEYAVVLKDTSLCYAIGVTEMMRQGRYIVARTFGNALLIYVVVAILYFILVIIGTQLLNLLERKFRIPGYEAKEKGEMVERML